MTKVTLGKHLIRLVYTFRGFVHYHDRKHGSREHGTGKVASFLMTILWGFLFKPLFSSASDRFLGQGQKAATLFPKIPQE